MEQPKPSDNADIIKERRNATFDVQTLTYIYDGGKDITNLKRTIQRKSLSDPKLKATKEFNFLDRSEQYTDAMRRCINLLDTAQEYGLKTAVELSVVLAITHPFDRPALALHKGMFVPTLLSNGSEEQKRTWMDRCDSFEVMGTYAQTELGHGTHVRGLETTATYDPDTEEFILNSPTTSAIKFWPGGLGIISNHAVVVAQLYTQGRCYGVHQFIVQLRSMETHQTMPGISVGDIGPKFGYNTVDNGFLRLDHVRIPRANMLARYSEVLKQGSFIKKDSGIQKPAYAAMVLTRANMLGVNITPGLAATVTIAIRYSAVRRQGSAEQGVQDVQILDFQTQQYKLLPLLAMTYAFKFTARAVVVIYTAIAADIEAGKATNVPEMHALTAGLKAYTSTAVAAGMVQCRLACGGHGYSAASGLPKIYTVTTPSCTYEGETTVMYLQTARYLLKVHQMVQDGKVLPSTVAYIGQRSFDRCTITPEFTLVSLVEACQYRAKRMIQQANRRLEKLQTDGNDMPTAWNYTTIDLVNAAAAHCHLYSVDAFVKEISSVGDENVAMVLTQLCQLYALDGIRRHLAVYLEEGYMSRSQVDLVERKVLSLLADIRPNAVALVDAFDFSDHQLGSVLGRFDGHVYDNLYKWAAESPLNDQQVHLSYDKYLRPLKLVFEAAKL